MEDPKVIIFASYEEIGSVYPPLNLAVEAATTGAEVIVAFSCTGATLMNCHSLCTTNKHDPFPLSSVMILQRLAIQYGVTFVVPDPDCSFEYKDIPIKNVTQDWIQEQTASAKVVVRI